MGSLYMGLLGIELFGIYAALKACLWPLQQRDKRWHTDSNRYVAKSFISQVVLLPKSFGHLACHDNRNDAHRDSLQVQGNRSPLAS